MNKEISKKIFRKNKIKSPKYFMISKDKFNSKRLKIELKKI